MVVEVWELMVDKLLGVRVDLRSWFVLGLAWEMEAECADGGNMS